MKIVIRICLLIALTFLSINAKSQNVVYIPGIIITVSDSVTYICNYVARGRRAYNSANVMTNLYYPTHYNDGTEIDPDREGVLVRLDDSFLPKIRSIIKAALNNDEIARIQDDFLWLQMYYNTDTGELIEPEFIFSNSDTGYITIPAEKLYQIDMQMREKLDIVIGEYGQTLPWMYMIFRVHGSTIRPHISPPVQPVDDGIFVKP